MLYEPVAAIVALALTKKTPLTGYSPLALERSATARERDDSHLPGRKLDYRIRVTPSFPLSSDPPKNIITPKHSKRVNIRSRERQRWPRMQRGHGRHSQTPLVPTQPSYSATRVGCPNTPSMAYSDLPRLTYNLPDLHVSYTTVTLPLPL